MRWISAAWYDSHYSVLIYIFPEKKPTKRVVEKSSDVIYTLNGISVYVTFQSYGYEAPPLTSRFR